MSAVGAQAAYAHAQPGSHSQAQKQVQNQAQSQAQKQDDTAPSYSFQGRHIQAGTWAFRQAVADAYVTHARPHCLCAAGLDGLGPPMYIARLGSSASPNPSYVLKRMPGTGSQHAPQCPSYEPPAELSGLGQLLGSAIVEDPLTGETTLKLDFPLSKQPGRSTTPTQGEPGASVKSDGTRMSLRGLLHYLWDQAELTRWHPGFAGKRNWAVVRKQLLATASDKFAGGQALSSRLYVPEMFSVEQRDAIHARRLAFLSQGMTQGARQPLMLLIGEVKEIIPARYGYKAVIKHVPDQGFAIDDKLYRRLGRRFEGELALWRAADRVHLIMMASFQVTEVGMPNILELSLIATTLQWLPVEDGFELELVERLVNAERKFRKSLRYGLAATAPLPAALLIGKTGDAVPLFIDASGNNVAEAESNDGVVPFLPQGPRWVWKVGNHTLPTLPDSPADPPSASNPAQGN